MCKWYISIKKNKTNSTIISLAAGGAVIFPCRNGAVPVQHSHRTESLGTTDLTMFHPDHKRLMIAKSSKSKVSTAHYQGGIFTHIFNNQNKQASQQ